MSLGRENCELCYQLVNTGVVYVMKTLIMIAVVNQASWVDFDLGC